MAGARWPRAFGLAVVLVSLPMCPAEAQGGKLTGVVTDERTGTPIDGAQVIVRETGLSAVTGANGRYFVLNVRPGTHTLSVRYLGHVSAEVRNVVVVVDLTRVVDVALGPVGLANEIHVRAMEVPLVEVGSTGSRTNVRAEEIEVLPVTGLWDVLALQAGFFQLPPNSDIIAYVDTRRIPNAPVRVRGGRAGETLALLDGFPINNVVFGGPAFDVGLEAVEQIDYQRGGFEAQYGNALSGIVHTVTREGGTRLEGDLRATRRPGSPARSAAGRTSWRGSACSRAASRAPFRERAPHSGSCSRGGSRVAPTGCSSSTTRSTGRP
jgi:hypothetical protein